MKNIEYGTEFLDQLKDSVHDLYDENKELKDRISKAIEYIEKELDIEKICRQEKSLTICKKELLEILDKG